MNLNLLEVMVFKSPTQVDWKATEEEVMNKVINTFPEGRASEIAMLSATLCTEIRKMIKRVGVRNAYQQLNRIKIESENKDA